ncbi:Cytochrome c heme lyase subunit CcmF [Escherichia coli ISC7]|uniref:Cytochrome c heme lyase subunit CcmF n=1 Tax=Escherichia coli ISC7 TaxID=1432555 RepID=W1F8N7_ECOLX|nr:Cytochrome c heme lyase subunit CcmF [Escherichia coli ISC7]
MMPEIGNGLLCLALGIALLLSVYPLWGVARGDARMMASSRLFAWLLFMSVAGAFLVLVNAFVVNDFTVTYVASNSNTQLPVWYRVAATWGAHEGSLLLWVLLMSGWTFAVAIFSQRIPLDIVARVLAIMGMVSVGFLLFILFTSNPFSRTLPNFPIEGRDLNPLLQDPGLIFHPPLLYMGYVGFSVAFAFAIASLLSGRLDSTYARFYSSVDAGGVDLLDARHCARFRMGLLRTRLGRLVVLGSGRKRLVYAVAGGDCADALTGGH